MRVPNSRFCVLVMAALCLAACGKQERVEAVQLGKALAAKKADYASANSTEKGFIASARDWCAGIVANGAGRGEALDQNASVASQIAKSAVAVSAQLGQVREAVDAVTLSEEFTRDVRNTLITKLTKRQRQLQDMRALLEQAAPQFLDYRNNKAYGGDTYPAGIDKLNAMLDTYHEPEDALATALGALTTKYHLAASEL